jgi:hypothetical protein
MCRIKLFVLTGMAILVTGLAWAQKQSGPRRPAPVMRSDDVDKRPVMKMITAGNLTPTAITFTSSTPDGAQSDGATKITFSTSGTPPAFHIYAVANAANFTGCNAPPASAVTAACANPSGVSCAASAPLTTAAAGTTLVTGKGNQTNASFNVNLTFQDAWNYSVGSTCQLIVTYYYSEP